MNTKDDYGFCLACGTIIPKGQKFCDNKGKCERRYEREFLRQHRTEKYGIAEGL